MRPFGLAVLTMSLALVATAIAEEPKKTTPATSELPGKGKVQWNLHGLSDRFTVVKVKYEPDARRATWLIEAKTDLNLKPADLATGLFDEDKVRLSQDDLEIEGGIQDLPPPVVNPFLVAQPPVKVQKGERVRVSLTLPDEEAWEKVRFVMVASKAIPDDVKETEKK